MNLRECKNEKCKINCNSEDRKSNTINGICLITDSSIDNLPVRCVGSWAYDKIYRVNQYFGIFSKGMHNKWNGLNYIEICSGPGRCVIKKTGQEIDGTSLSIINNNSFKYITNAVFIDFSEKVISALNDRIKNLGVNNSIASYGDYCSVQTLEIALDGIDTNLLTLIFIDPTDCSVPFSTIEFLRDKFPNIDIIFNFAYGTDMLRNIRISIDKPATKVREKYNSFFGNSNFLSNPNIIKLKNSSVESNQLAFAFLEEYKKNLKSIGLDFSAEKNIRNYYWLLYATGNERGLKFWEDSQRISPNHQREIQFD